VWLAALAQPFDVERWIGWLEAEAEDGLIARLWRALDPVSREIAVEEKWPGLYIPSPFWARRGALAAQEGEDMEEETSPAGGGLGAAR
jgi:hypothetical protein